MNKKLIPLLIVIVSLFILSGCAYKESEYDPNYIEIYPAINSGWYINGSQPYLVFNDNIFVPAILDTRIVGDWLISGDYGDIAFTFTPDNHVLIENALVGEWYWATSDTLLVVGYPTEQFSEVTISTLQIVFLDGTDDFAQFTEYDMDGNYSSFLGVHVDE